MVQNCHGAAQYLSNRALHNCGSVPALRSHLLRSLLPGLGGRGINRSLYNQSHFNLPCLVQSWQSHPLWLSVSYFQSGFDLSALIAWDQVMSARCHCLCYWPSFTLVSPSHLTPCFAQNSCSRRNLFHLLPRAFLDNFESE